MRKKVDEGGGGPSWLDTYADMVTLLLTFFVLLFSMSTIDAQKWEVLVKSFKGGFNSNQQIVINTGETELEPGNGMLDPGGNKPGLGSDEIPQDEEAVLEVMEFDDLYPFLKQYLESQGLQNDIELFKGEGYVYIIFRNNVFFNPNSPILRTSAYPILDKLLEGLAPVAEDLGEVSCEGHTARVASADTPNDTYENWNLSCERASQVIWYIDGKKIVDPFILHSSGNADHHPIVPHDGTEETRIKNRRVEIYIAKKDIAKKSLSEIYAEINADPEATTGDDADTDQSAGGTTSDGASTDQPAGGTTSDGASTDQPAGGTTSDGAGTDQPAGGTTSDGAGTDQPAEAGAGTSEPAGEPPAENTPDQGTSDTAS